MHTTGELAEVLSEVRKLLARRDNDFWWSHWEDSADALDEFDSISARVLAGDDSGRGELKLLFAPTGSLQEVSLNSRWGEAFLVLSRRFDELIDHP